MIVKIYLRIKRSIITKKRIIGTIKTKKKMPNVEFGEVITG